MILIDRSVPKPVAEALKQVRADVSWFEDHFEHRTKETEWLPVAGANSWLVILRDKKVKSRPGERQAIIDNRVGCFILNQGNDPTKWQYLQLLAKTLDDMERTFATEERPFIFLVDREGRMRRWPRLDRVPPAATF